MNELQDRERAALSQERRRLSPFSNPIRPEGARLFSSEEMAKTSSGINFTRVPTFK